VPGLMSTPTRKMPSPPKEVAGPAGLVDEGTDEGTVKGTVERTVETDDESEGGIATVVPG
jgi:hypothetical protein